MAAQYPYYYPCSPKQPSAQCLRAFSRACNLELLRTPRPIVNEFVKLLSAYLSKWQLVQAPRLRVSLTPANFCEHLRTPGPIVNESVKLLSAYLSKYNFSKLLGSE